MLKSQAPRSTTVKKAAEESVVTVISTSAPPNNFRRRVATASRWLHIYVSMVSFAIVLFFAVTGLTLNHQEWFGTQPRVSQQKGQLDLKWVKPPDANVDKLAVVEFLRRTHGVKGSVSDTRLDEGQFAVSFKGPGYTADAFINRETGEYDLTETRMGLVAVMNDLHKGRDSGRAWSLIIDASALLMTFVSLTGLILIWFLKRRRVSGLALVVVGAVICGLIYLLLTP